MASCATCHNLTRSPSAYRYTLDTTYRTLQSSADLGCIYCELLCKGIMAFVPDASQTVGYIGMFGAAIDDDLSLLRVDMRRSDRTELYVLEFFQDSRNGDHQSSSDDNRQRSSLRPARRIPGNTADDHSFDFICQHIQECLETHSACAQFMSDFMPKRLLDLGHDFGTTIRLLEDVDDVEPYVCLSHCWGLSRRLVTETSNIAMHRTAISLDSLPRTFRDAVTVTRKLGIRYLWVDSLCILQNSVADWAEQSAKMKSVFQHAYITVSATHSMDDIGGCFTEPQYVKTDVSLQIEGLPRVRVREPIVHWTAAEKEADSHFPLLRRAWAFQERQLSPRLLHFCQSEVVWDCYERLDCECGFVTSRPTCKIGTNSLANVTSSDRPLAWRNHVTSYSRMYMTKDSDKLPAIAGFASFFGSPEAYAAGLWCDNSSSDRFWEDLSWTAVNPKAGRPREWRAPTWSWASITGPITFAHYEDEALGRLRLNNLEPLPDLLFDHPDILISTHAVFHMNLTAYMLMYGESRILAARHVSATCVPRHESNSFGELSSGYISMRSDAFHGSIACVKNEREDDDDRGHAVVIALDPSERLSRWYPLKVNLDAAIPSAFDNQEILCVRTQGTSFLVLRHAKSAGAQEKLYERIGILHLGVSVSSVAAKSFEIFRAIAERLEMVDVRVV